MFNTFFSCCDSAAISTQFGHGGFLAAQAGILAI
jgi:hypothetical protein